MKNHRKICYSKSKSKSVCQRVDESGTYNNSTLVAVGILFIITIDIVMKTQSSQL